MALIGGAQQLRDHIPIFLVGNMSVNPNREGWQHVITP